MFDLRYHVASLAAIFIALAVGIVIGVAIASGGSVDKATKSFQQSRIDELNRQLEAAQARTDRSEKQQAAVSDLMEEAYPLVMSDRLANAGCAVLFLGPINGGVRSAVEKTLTDADSGPPVRLTALELPVDSEALATAVAENPLLAAYAGEGRIADLGKALGEELVEGGPTPLWKAVENELVQEQVGASSPPVRCAVVTSNWQPEETDDQASRKRDAQTEDLIDGVLSGLDDSGIPVAAVESAGTEPSSVGVFRDSGISTVNDVDTLPGRVALALLLAGGDAGHYGTGDGAPDGVSPPVEPLPATTVAG